MTPKPRHVTVERIDADVYLLTVGTITLALTYLEMSALRHEVAEAADDGG